MKIFTSSFIKILITSLFLGFFNFCPLSAYAKEVDSQNADTSQVLYPIKMNGKWGYIDRNGKIAIKPQFDRAEKFSEGLAVVSVAGQKGFINKQGKFVVNPKFWFAGSFIEGLAPVSIGRSDPTFTGYIDHKGVLTPVPMENSLVFDFSEGLAKAESKDNKKWGFLNKKGEFVIAPEYGVALNFSDGLASVQVGKFDLEHGKWGAIDKNGKMVIAPEFDYIGSFSDGLASVMFGIGFNGKWGFINKEGKLLINPEFDAAWDFSEGLAMVKVGDKWGFIDKQGTPTIKPLFESALPFSEGLAAVRVGDEKTGKWGFIDKNGNMIIKPSFDVVESFSDGLARIGKGNDNNYDNMAYIDKTGNYIWKSYQ